MDLTLEPPARTFARRPSDLATSHCIVLHVVENERIEVNMTPARFMRVAPRTSLLIAAA